MELKETPAHQNDKTQYIYIYIYDVKKIYRQMPRNIEPYRKRRPIITFSVNFRKKVVKKGNCFSAVDVLH